MIPSGLLQVETKTQICMFGVRDEGPTAEEPGNRNRRGNIGKPAALVEGKERRPEAPAFFRSYPIWAAWGRGTR
jgi:hypothetical protein